MLKKLVIGTFMAASTLVSMPQVASAQPDCALDCFWVDIRNADGDIVGGYWECPDNPTTMDCVE
jgi:hypothetical protein